MFSSFAVSASGMAAQRIRINTIASNLANVNTTRGAGGQPYRRRDVVFSADPVFSNLSGSGISGTGPGDGVIPVKVIGIIEDSRPFKRVYEPGHPDADSDGYLLLPNVNPLEEMVNMMSAMRAYEANVAALKSEKEMKQKALDIAR